MRTASWPGIFLALSAAILWGTTGTAQHFAQARLSPYWIGALRLLIASGCFLALVAASERRAARAPLPAGLWWRPVLAGVCMAAYNLAFFAGVRAAGVAVGTAIAIGSGPLFAGAIQAAVTRRAPVPLWWLGTVLAVAGGAAIALGGGGASAAGLAGIPLCLLAGLSYAGYTLLAKGLSGHASPARASLWVFAVAAAIALPAAWLAAPSGPADLVAAGERGWLVVAWLGVAATGLSYLLFTSALRFITAATGVALALAEPLTAFTLAVTLLGEPLRASGLAGIAAILAGLALVIAAERRG